MMEIYELKSPTLIKDQTRLEGATTKHYKEPHSIVATNILRWVPKTL